MSTYDPNAPQFDEELVPDTRTWFERAKDFVLDEAPSWLASMVIHMVVLLLIALFFGHAMVDEMVGDAPTFEARQVESGEEPEIERFNMGDTPIDPAGLTLDTESLTLKEPPGQAQQEAMYYSDDKTFEQEGGGTLAGLESGAGGLGINIKAEGLGPVLRGAGGMEQGKGEGLSFGRGGAGEGFGGRGQGSREALLGRYGGTKQTERAVAGALNWLARHQNPDGSWSVHRYRTRCKDQSCTGQGNTEADAGGTAMGLLPFLGAGQTHRSPGPYKRQISKAVNWFISRQRPNGDLSAGTAHQMYSHGLAAIALCEAYGMTGDSHVGRAARSAVNFILKAQNAQGGWRYTANTNDSDTSVFAWEMMALKSATMAGISVDPMKVELARKWLDTVTEGGRDANFLGQFAYQRGRPPTPSMSAAALLIVQYTGAARNDPVIAGGLKYLQNNAPNLEDRDTYYWYYATQVFHNVAGPEWDAWNRQMRRILIETQVRTGCATGSWDPDKPTGDLWGPLGGRLMMTSLSALTLEIYYRYLPLYKLDTDAEGKAKPAAGDAKSPEKEEKQKAAPKKDRKNDKNG